MRTANRTVAQAGLSWDILLESDEKPQPKTVVREPTDKPMYEVDDLEVGAMLSYIYANAWDGFDFSFVDSIQENFAEYGKLTWKQAKSLKNVYSTIKSNKNNNWRES